MRNKMNTHKSNFKSSLFRLILNKGVRCQGNVGKVPQAYMIKKADSPRNFSEKILKLVGILLWIIVALNILITFLIYKILF
jgi:hypothetical protein